MTCRKGIKALCVHSYHRGRSINITSIHTKTGERVTYHGAYRLWLKKDDEFVMSEGRARLLSLVKEHRSISVAAEQMNMSYRYAWGMIRKMEDAIGEPIVASKRGGSSGGSSSLTKKGEEVLNEYDRMREQGCSSPEYVNPTLTVDGVIVRDDEIVLIRRGRGPFKGRLALPGGILEYGEKAEDAVVREVLEETGIKTMVLELLGVYSDPRRDPRGHFITLAYHLKATGGELVSGDDAGEVVSVPLDSIPPLAFDHDRIVMEFLNRRFH